MSTRLAAAPGHVVSETAHATTYRGANAVTFEGDEVAYKIGVRFIRVRRQIPNGFRLRGTRPVVDAER